MELRELAERVVFATTLEEKLWSPEAVTDDSPGVSIAPPPAPGRPANLLFKPQGSARSDFPGLHRLEDIHERGRLLHFFANHELLATELMALVLLRFPDAPPAFRRGVFQTLKDEQLHTKLYLRRMEACGIGFGELPVSGYFWRCISAMEHPIDYVAGLCLTFEQANLDFCQHFANAFGKVGDESTARLLGRVYRDEIGHVAYGLKWFRRWKRPDLSDWEAFCRQLKFPLSPQRAKGPELNIEGRREAGFDSRFIDELGVYSKSKGRTPSVFLFNPFTEGYIAQGKSFTPRGYQAALARDLANLPQFLCRQDDVVLVPKRPAAAFLSGLQQAGFPLPEFVELCGGEIPADSDLRQRKLGELRPWAWGPDSVRILRPLIHHPECGCAEGQPVHTPTPLRLAFGTAAVRSLAASGTGSRRFSEAIAGLYSKSWSAALLGGVVAGFEDESWICSAADVGAAVNSLEAALEAIARIRAGGHHRIVVKEAVGLAGHNAIRLWEPQVLEPQRRWMERAMQNGRELVVEPWHERLADFSIQLEMGQAGLKVVGYTGLMNDRKGQFQGNWAAPNWSRAVPAPILRLVASNRDIAARLSRLYETVFAALEAELSSAGYLGPLGIDALVYRDNRGGSRIKPIVEINPRYTMGRLTLELMRAVAPGNSGVFRIVSRSALRAMGFPGFIQYAESLAASTPLRLGGEPVPKITQGTLCLTDPSAAEVCLATIQVDRDQPQYSSGRS